MSERNNHSYRQIFKSSVIIGGSSVVTVLLGVVRTKVLAVMIGTEGMGLFGAFNSVVSLVGGIAGMGINTSGVRQIAEAVGSGDQDRIARTVHVLRWTSVILGGLGMIVLLAFCRPISMMTFGSNGYALALAVLSITVLFTEISNGQRALVQGMRRIRDLAALTISGAVLGTALSIPIIYFFRERGIVPFLVTVSALTIVASWWYARKIRVERVQLPHAAVWADAKSLLVMGSAFMISGLMTSGVAYLTRVMIIRQMNLEAAGLFQAATNISSVYVGFILSAMGADYYPRLTTVSDNHAELNHQVNEQTESAMLMALPGIMATLTFAPWVISVLYSSQFMAAVEILRWQVLGVLGRVVLWPIAFVLLAKGNAKAYIAVEVFSNMAHVGLIWFGMKWFGLAGLGMAFATLYVLFGLVLLPLVHRLTGFKWTRGNMYLIVGALAATLIVFGIMADGHPQMWSVGLGTLITSGAAVFSVRKLGQRMGYTSFTALWAACLTRLIRMLGRT